MQSRSAPLRPVVRSDPVFLRHLQAFAFLQPLQILHGRDLIRPHLPRLLHHAGRLPACQWCPQFPGFQCFPPRLRRATSLYTREAIRGPAAGGAKSRDFGARAEFISAPQEIKPKGFPTEPSRAFCWGRVARGKKGRPLLKSSGRPFIFSYVPGGRRMGWSWRPSIAAATVSSSREKSATREQGFFSGSSWPKGTK